MKNEGLEKFQSHFFRQPALMKFQFRADYNNSTSGIIYSFPQQILTETSLLTFEHIANGLERPFIGTNHWTPTTTIIEKCIHRFLQHSLFIFDNNSRCTQFDETLETVVSMNHTTIQIIEVTGCKAATFERNQRS